MYQFQVNKYDIMCPQSAYKNMVGDKEKDETNKYFIQTYSMAYSSTYSEFKCHQSKEIKSDIFLQAQEKAMIRLKATEKMSMKNKMKEQLAMSMKMSSKTSMSAKSKAHMMSRFKATSTNKSYYELDDSMLKALLEGKKNNDEEEIKENEDQPEFNNREEEDSYDEQDNWRHSKKHSLKGHFHHNKHHRYNSRSHKFHKNDDFSDNEESDTSPVLSQDKMIRKVFK